MSRYALWGVAAAAALAAAPAARAATDDQRGDPGQTNESRGSSSAMEHGKNPAASSASTSDTTPGKDVRTSSDQGSTSASSTSATGSHDTTGAKSGVSKHDNSDLIPKLYRSNLMEVESAKIAEKNAQSQGVKDFAKQLERDHKEMADSLKKLADNRKLKLDDSAMKKQNQAHLDQMKNMKGATFDQHYTQMMVSEHEKDLSDVKAALQQTRQTGDHELTAVLEKAQTTMEGHHRMALDLEHNKGSSQMQGRRPSDSSSSSTAPSSTGSTPADRAGAAGTTGTTDATGGSSSSSSAPSDTHGGSSSGTGSSTNK